MENSNQVQKQDLVFKIPKPVLKSKCMNSQLRNGAEFSLKFNRNNELSSYSNNRYGNTSQYQSFIKVPSLNDEYRNNESMAISANRSNALSVSDSRTQVAKKQFLFDSSSSNTSLLLRGSFNPAINSTVRENFHNSLRLPLPLNVTSRADDQESYVGSEVMSHVSTMGMRAQLVNIFESLESTIIQKQSCTEDELRSVVRKAKEVALMTLQNETSLALSFRDRSTAASEFAESARSLCNSIQAQKSIRYGMKSRDVLSNLKLNAKQGFSADQTSVIQYHTHYSGNNVRSSPVRKAICMQQTKNVDNKEDDDDDDDEKENDSFIFKEKKVKINIQKKANEVSNKTKKQNSKDIALTNWFPVVSGQDLALSGENERKNRIVTKPIKKRVNNRLVELIDGCLCELKGNPAPSVVSAISKENLKKLENGLPMRYKVLIKSLYVEPVVVLKKKDMLTSKSKENNVSERNIGKNKQKSPKEKEIRKDNKIVEVAEKRKSCAEENVQRSRSGRTIKPLSEFWRGFTVDGKTDKAEISSFLKSKKRKSKDQEYENRVKRFKKKEPSPGKGKKKLSPEMNNSIARVPSPRKNGTPLPGKLKQTKINKYTMKINTAKETKRKKNEDTKKSNEKEKVEKKKNTKPTDTANDYNDSFEYSLGDIKMPEVNISDSNTQKLSKSQIRMISMETPPLKYFTGNLRLAKSVTPTTSPAWELSQRTESEVKKFQKRREKIFKQKIPAAGKADAAKVRKSPRIKDLNNLMAWVADKDVKSPVKRSKVLDLVIPSRRYQEEDDDEESSGGDYDD